jgi:hypothetical protein
VVDIGSDRWRIGLHPSDGLCRLYLHSEGAGRESANLLSGPIRLTWRRADLTRVSWSIAAPSTWVCSVPEADGDGVVTWTVTSDGDELLWQFDYSGSGCAEDLRIEMPMSPLQTASVLTPSAIDAENRGLGPWLLVAPDFGHLRVEARPPNAWTGANDGCRGAGSSATAPPGGIDPSLRGEAWLDAVKLPDYVPGKILVRMACKEPLRPGKPFSLRFAPQELSVPSGLTDETWKRIGRPYLNHWQPCGAWAGPASSNVLANNVLSDPASVSLWFYAEPMLFVHEPLPGIDLRPLLRHSLDYWLDNHVSAQGHVNAFGKMYDLYVSSGACLIIAAWDYWTVSQDRDWVGNRIGTLHLMADYILRRDVDDDGLIESYGSGNAGSLRDPDRADIWFEMMNFGHKNAWTNLLAYRAFLSLADMLGQIGQANGAAYYTRKAEELRNAFVRQMLGSENGWFVSWISQDGEVHDYCHTFINGMAVAYGIVAPDEGRRILERVVEKSESVGFDHWQLGVPGNLIPCRKLDMIQARIGIDGAPVNDHFYWPDDLTDEAAFGYRYPNGTIHPALVWPYILGLQVAGLDAEADRILDAMIDSAQKGLFQNGIVNVGFGGAEHFLFNGKTCGYEGFLPESYNFLMGVFTRQPRLRSRLLRPLQQHRAATP